MDTKLVRTHEVVRVGWAVLLLGAGYALAFYVFALTMTSFSLVA
jgi:hypothetical protein